MVIPEGVTSIASEAIDQCEALETVYWNAIAAKNVSSRTDVIFYDCSALKNFIISKKVKSLPTYCMKGLGSNVEVDLDLPLLENLDKNACDSAKISAFNAPKLTKISDSAFS